MKVEKVVEEFLRLVFQEKMKEAEELVVKEARGREDEVAYYLSMAGAEIGDKGYYVVALYCFKAAEKAVKSEDLMKVIIQNLAIAHNNYANLLRETKRPEEAESHYKEALRINPEYADVQYNYAIMLQEMKRYEEAESHYKEALRINPEYAQTHYNYAIMLQEMKRYEEAGSHYKEALRINPEYADVQYKYNYAIMLQEMKRYEEAESHYKEALRINPEYAQTHYNYAIMLQEMKRYEEAESHYKEALRINPEYANAHYNYAILLRKMKRYEEAESYCKESLRINPEYADVHNNYAVLLAKMKRYEEAESYCKESLRINPEYADAHYNYATMLAKMKRYEEAESHYKEALRINPEYAEASANLGILYLTSNKLGSASNWLEKARTLFEKQDRNFDSKKAEAHINWITARKFWESFSFSRKDTHFNLEKSQEYYLEAAAKFREINLVVDAQFLEFLSDAIFISKEYLHSLDSENLMEMRGRMNRIHDSFLPLYEEIKEISFPDINLLRAQFICIDTLKKCLNFEDVHIADIHEATDIFNNYNFDEPLQATTALVNVANKFKEYRKRYKSIEEIPKEEQEEILKMVQPFSVYDSVITKKMDELTRDKSVTLYTGELRKVVREELKESEKRILSGLEQISEKSRRELLEKIETLGDIQLEKFKNAVSMIIEARIENMDNPEEREKSRKEYNNWKRAFNAAFTAVQILGSLSSIYTFLTTGDPEEVINMALSQIERI